VHEVSRFYAEKCIVEVYGIDCWRLCIAMITIEIERVSRCENCIQ